MTEQVTGSATVEIARPAEEIFAAISDVTRMGEWSPETTACRWITDDGPALGSTFEGDNVASLGPVTLKRWTTTSEVTAFDPPRTFEFVAEGYTTWRYELLETDGVTRVTETFAHEQYPPMKKIFYNLLGNRGKAMEAGMGETLGRLKAALEA